MPSRKNSKLTMQKMLSYISEEDKDAIREGREEALTEAINGFE